MRLRSGRAGFPILMIAFLGGFVHKLVPNVLSFSDFVQRRFGTVVQIVVSILMYVINNPSALSVLVQA